MKKDILQRAKGVRDFGPAEKIARDKIVDSLKSVFEKFGYNPIETPVLERYDLFGSKFSVGEESDAMKETFKLKDQGGRDLVLRNEFTAPFARFVGMNQQLRMPFKRYQIGSVFRDGPIKLGRYREFYQCDVDCVGVDNSNIDAELLFLIDSAFKALDLEVEIQINSRKILDKALETAGIPEKQRETVIISIDKLEKIGSVGVKKELTEKGIDSKAVDQVLEILTVKGVEKLKDCEGLNEIKQTLKLAKELKNVKFVPTLARGLAYYTGNVFEVFLKDKSKISSSICAGGRYDKMIGGYLGTKETIPSIGVSFGLEIILDALKENTLQEPQGGKKSVVDVYIIPVGEEQLEKAFDVAKKLRLEGIKVDIDLLNRKVGKNLEYANSYGIPSVIIIGEDEVKENKVTFRDMNSGKQEKFDLDSLVDKIKN